jgi:cyclic pyranopterin phosphate synthase
MNNFIDTYNRPINYMRISITDRCNLRCHYCMPEDFTDWKPKEEILRYEEILRIVGVAASRGLKKVRVTGGEPLVRRGVVDFVRALHAIPGIETVALTTNGVFLKETAKALFDAGLRHINISLDSLHPETFAQIVKRDIFHRVWEGIEECEQIGFNPIKINCVLQAGLNDHEVNDFARLTLQKPYHVRFIEFMPCANWERWVNTYRPFQASFDRIEAEMGLLSPVGQPNEGTAGPAENFRLPGGKGVVGFIHAISHDFCGTCNRIRLTAEGQMRPCLYSSTGVDFKSAIRSGCTDTELSALLDQVMQVKPKYHELDVIPQEKQLFTMVNIGG